AVQRVADYRAAGDGVWAGSVRSAGERDAAGELCAEPVDQAGRQAGDQWRGCDRGAAHAGERGAGAGGATRGGTTESAGRGVAQFVGKEDLRFAEHGRTQGHRRYRGAIGVELFRGSGYAV